MSPSGDSVSGPGKTHQVGGSIPANDRKRRNGARKGRPRRRKEQAAGSRERPASDAYPSEIEPEAQPDRLDTDNPGDGAEGGHVDHLA